jgi:hypothetical protein
MDQHDQKDAHFDSLGNREWVKVYYGDSVPPFIKGLDLCEIFFREQVEPIVREVLPHTPIAAGRLDYGSDVLGYDTELSRDHAWGPQVTLYLSEEDVTAHHDLLQRVLQKRLPFECRGYSTRMTSEVIWRPATGRQGHHRVRIESVRSFFEKEIGITPGSTVSVAEWLSMPAQKLRVLASGRIFVDDSKELTTARDSLRWYPRDVWLHVMAAQWQKLLDRAPFAGRCAHVGDMWGAADSSSETIRNLVCLAFLLERQYPPYNKWLGTALKELSIGPELISLADRVRCAQTWPEQEDALVAAYQLVANRHNQDQTLPPIPTEVTTFYSRPYRMIDMEGIVRVLREAVEDPVVRQLSLVECAVWQMVAYDAALYSPTFPKVYRELIRSGALR